MISSPKSGVRPLDFYFDAQRRSISFIISSAQRTASDIAATVAGTFPSRPPYASFLAAKIDAEITAREDDDGHRRCQTRACKI